MHLAIFGLTISSSWGNGHATLWRALVKALARRGHTVAFFERDVPYYAAARDGWIPPIGSRICFYNSVEEVARQALRECDRADLAIYTSFCPEGPEIARLIIDSGAAVKAFYDLDTPITLDAARRGRRVDYLPEDGLGAFDLVLSYTGGKALDELKSRLGARNVLPLYGSVDPESHFPVAPVEYLRGALSYLGTYAADRQQGLETMFVAVARRMTDERFQLAGAQYPEGFPGEPNICFAGHLPPSMHPAFFCSSRATLNLTRTVMAENGYCPSGRLFEAAACGTAILSDCWTGLDTFFRPGTEILLVRGTNDVMDVLSLSDVELRRIGEAARARVLAEHTAEQRGLQLEALCDRVVNAA